MTSNICTSTASAYYAQIHGQQYADDLNKRYLEGLPPQVKEAGGVVGILVYKKLHVGLVGHFAVEMTPDQKMLVFKIGF